MWSSILTGPKLKNTGKSSITTTQTLFLSADMSEMLLTLWPQLQPPGGGQIALPL